MNLVELVNTALGSAAVVAAFGLFKWAFDVRRKDMEEIRTLAKTDLDAVKEIRREDMEEIRGSLRSNDEAHSRLGGAISEVGRGVVDLNEKVGFQNSRVGRLETWKEDHTLEDDRAHAEIGVLKEEHSGVLQDIAILKARNTRRSKVMAEAIVRRRPR